MENYYNFEKMIIKVCLNKR